MNWLESIAIVIKLVSGGLFYTSLKTLGQAHILTISGEYGYFKRSFFLCAVLFISLSMSLIVYGCMLLTSFRDKVGLNLKAWLRISVPGMLDCLGQICTMLGTMMLPISIVLVLKGSRVVFSAILSKLMLKRHLFVYHWCAVIICMLGLTIASLSSIFNQFHLRNGLGIGICLCLFGEFMRSVRMVLEERLMKTFGYNPVAMIGIEGLVGAVISVPLLGIVDAISGSDEGSYENWSNTIYMLSNSVLAVSLISLLPVWINALYLSGVFVTKMLSAVHNALITVLTVAVVWGLELLIYYGISPEYGHGWGTYSPLQLVGFVFILVSTLMYDAILRIPQIFIYPQNLQEAAGIANIETETSQSIKV